MTEIKPPSPREPATITGFWRLIGVVLLWFAAGLLALMAKGAYDRDAPFILWVMVAALALALAVAAFQEGRKPDEPAYIPVEDQET